MEIQGNRQATFIGNLFTFRRVNMKPISLAEKLMFNTVRIETLDGSSGTGFFFNFKQGELTIPVLITNKHVVNYK